MTTPIPPPQRFYYGYIKTNAGLRYLSMVQAVGPVQAKQRILADWKKAAPQMIQEIQEGKQILVVRRSSLKKAIREAPNIPSPQPKKTGFFNVFGQRTRVRMELDKKNRGV